MFINQLRIEKRDFHQLEKLNQNKCYQINIQNNFNDQSKSYFFNKEQILLLSFSVYEFIVTDHHPFNILFFRNEEANDYDLDDSILSAQKDYEAFIQAFNDIYSLFDTNESIQIHEENRNYFASIAEQLQNDALFQSCQSLGEFYFTTDNINTEGNYLGKDLTIKFKDFEILTNYAFASLISNKIRKSFQETQINTLDFSDFIFPHIFNFF
jgi:hypothetical protein